MSLLSDATSFPYQAELSSIMSEVNGVRERKGYNPLTEAEVGQIILFVKDKLPSIRESVAFSRGSLLSRSVTICPNGTYFIHLKSSAEGAYRNLKCRIQVRDGHAKTFAFFESVNQNTLPVEKSFQELMITESHEDEAAISLALSKSLKITYPKPSLAWKF